MKRIADPVFVGVFGDPVGHSLSPAMHNAAFKSLNLPYCYIKCRVTLAGLQSALRWAAFLGFRGVNLTIPLKERAVRLVDALTPQAKRAGAVNTVTFKQGRTEGHNTDGEGFLRSLQEELQFNPRGTRVAMLGAGGAARAVAFALADAGAAEISIFNRTPSRARRLAGAVRAASRIRVQGRGFPRGGGWKSGLAGVSLIVNAAAIGMRGEKCPVPDAALHARLRVVDLVYNPPLTDLIRAARRRRLPAINGIGMLAHQGALAFSRWTGRRAPVEVMRKALLLALPRG